jgi:CRISPR-associated exonuclease Cas4
VSYLSSLYDFLTNQIIVAIVQSVEGDGWFALLIFLLVFAAIVIDSLFDFIQRARRETGITRKMVVQSVDGGSFVSGRELFAPSLGLIGRPDAIVRENGVLIPLERKMSGAKLRDKDIAQLLIYCRLLEEIEGVRPSHGYLITGPNAKRIRVENSDERREWVEDILKDMRRSLSSGNFTATPSKRKCDGCSVRDRCKVRI